MRTSGLAGGEKTGQVNYFQDNLPGGNGSRCRGKLSVVGIGPGDHEHITSKAKRAVEEAEIIIGYDTYLNLLGELIAGKEVYRSPMKKEIERCQLAVELALAGKKVVVVSSGDPGVYGMAGPVLEVLGKEELKVEIIPGVTAATAAAAVLGAPLNHDFVVISLSDLLTSWQAIERRLVAAAAADFITVLYNPRSRKRKEQIVKAAQIFLEYRSRTTPVGIVKSLSRPQEKAVITVLEKMLEYPVDMLSTIIIGNSQTYISNGCMITPRGYRL